jgi:hypothetical protein
MIDIPLPLPGEKAGFVCGFLEDEGLSGKGGGWRTVLLDGIYPPTQRDHRHEQARHDRNAR